MAAKKTAKTPKKNPIKKTEAKIYNAVNSRLFLETNTGEFEPVFIERTDRKLRPISGKNAACPECGAFPTITKIRRPGYELRRCRECGHRFEIIRGGE